MKVHGWWIAWSVAGIAGCATEVTTVAFPTAQAERSCAPNDGPAVALSLYEAPIPPGVPVILIHVYRARTELATKTWSLGPPFDQGQALYCANAGGCEAATKATVRFSSTATDLVGEVDLSFPSRGLLQGPFRAAWRENNILCG